MIFLGSPRTGMRRARNWCREPDGFSSWPFEDEGGIGEFFSREAEGGAKEDLGRPAPGEGHEAHAFLEVAVAGEEFESGLDEGLRTLVG
jgi:hypothetical protein